VICTSNSRLIPGNIVVVSRSPIPSGSLTQSDSYKKNSSADRIIVYLSKLPENLSDWTRKTIEDLCIEVVFEPETRPLNVITRPAPCTGGLGIRISVYDVERIQKCQREKREKVSRLAELVRRSGFIDMIQNLNYTSFEDLNIDTLLKLNSFKDRSFLPSFGVPCELVPWFRRYKVQFLYCLRLLIICLLQYTYACIFAILS
jgi:hypothetical protein